LISSNYARSINMETTQFKKGDKVQFGRRNGEKTIGTVVKVNRKTLQIRQDEARGTQRDYKVGTVWKVPPSLCQPFNGVAPVVSVEAPKPKRSESEIMKDILGVYGCLSPENLTCDGELSYTQVRRRAASYRRQLKELFKEIGRTVSEDEAYRTAC